MDNRLYGFTGPYSSISAGECLDQAVIFAKRAKRTYETKADRKTDLRIARVYLLMAMEIIEADEAELAEQEGVA